MPTCDVQTKWEEFLEYIRTKCSSAEFENWFTPIEAKENDGKMVLFVPNVFVKEYLLENYKKVLMDFFSFDEKNLNIEFIIHETKEKKVFTPTLKLKKSTDDSHLNDYYTFENYIEGPSNQFVKSAAQGVALRPGKTFNPLFIHGGVGLGKTHLLHGIGNYIRKKQKKIRVQCITTEAFINDLVMHLRNKSIDKMKRYYRSLDVLLVDDIQFLQNRLNFEEEFCNTFEALINQNKQVVITSDKPPSQLKLSDRIIGRMEWGLVAHVSVPELETRVAIIKHKAQLKGLPISNEVAFFIADHIFHNIRQIEGAINRLAAYSHLMHTDISTEIAENLLQEMFEYHPHTKITVETILKSAASVFEIRISDIKGDSRLKNIALARQVAMYLAKELIDESLMKIAASFGGKTHSTLLHAWKKIHLELQHNQVLARQIQMIKKNLDS